MKRAYFNGSGKFLTTEKRMRAMEKLFSCKKAQSLSEMAIFGGLLLLVLSYLVRWGIGLTSQQDVQMRAFRMALDDSSKEYTRPDAESIISVVEDKWVPDPRNMVGKGDFVPASSQGDVVWGTQMQNPILWVTDLPSTKFVINGVVKTYNFGSLATLSNSMTSRLWVKLPDTSTQKNIQWSGAGNELRCYKPSPDSPQQARILTSEPDMETEIIIDVAIDAIDPKTGAIILVDGQPIPGPWWRIIDVPGNLNNGDPVNLLGVLMPESGGLDPSYMSLDYVKEHSDKVAPVNEPDPGSENYIQGLLPYAKVETRRTESLKLEEVPVGPGYTKSTTDFDSTGTTITRYIRLNSVMGPGLGVVESIPYSPPAAAVKGKWIWQSAK